MAGSQAVIAHEEAGQAVLVASSPPAMHVSQVLVVYCQKVAEATGSALFVIDRAVHAVALAQAFHANDLGLLCRLDDHEPAGLGSFEATEVDTLDDGTQVESGSWQECRNDAPRHCVMVAPAADKTLVYWGTPQVEEAREASAWPRVYRERNEMQARSCTGMIDPGGLEINHGRNTIRGPDRHQQRQQAPLAQSLETAHQRVAKQAEAVTAHQDQVAESEATGHGTRLEQRQRPLVTWEQE